MKTSAVEESNFQLFRDILASLIIEKCAPSESKTRARARKAKAGRKNAIKPIERGITAVEEEERNDAEELGEFIDYLASEIFTSLPPTIRTMTYHTSSSLTPSQTAPQTLLAALPISITETIETYSLLSPSQTVPELLTPPLTTYLTTLCTPPLPPSQTKDLATGCEICGRDWIPLTYHHLIPRSVHAKVVKRGWHGEEDLGSVAWLCRACHSFVHRVCGHEELAREFYTVERLVAREDVRAFGGWVGGVRWKSQ